MLVELEGVEGLDDVPLLVVDRPVLDAVAGFPVHRGVLALGARLPFPGVDGPRSGRRARWWCWRTATTTRTWVRSPGRPGPSGPRRWCSRPGAPTRSTGAACGSRWARSSASRWWWRPAWPDGLGELRAAGFTVLALTPAADAVDLDTWRSGAEERVAVLLGAEGPGLTGAAQAAADRRVRIPIVAGVDSLNVGHAAAVALHHVAAARRARDADSRGRRCAQFVAPCGDADEVSHGGMMGPKYLLTK